MNEKKKEKKKANFFYLQTKQIDFIISAEKSYR